MVHPRPLSWLVRRAPIAAIPTATALAACLVAAPARAGERLVVVIDVDPRVSSALVVALSPWSLTVVRAPGPSPSSDLDASSSRASAIAAEQHAGAVVWIAAPRALGEQPALWVYDAQTKQVAVRPLSVSEPFDDAGAASVALSVKTILRASPLTTEETPPEPEPPGSIAGPSPMPVDRPPATVPGPQPPASARAWRFETVVGVRAPTGASAAVEPRAALGGSFWPSGFGGHAGLGFDVQAGPGVSVGTPNSFQGELREASMELTARARVLPRRWLAVEAECGPAVFLASLDGQAVLTGAHVHTLRLDPAMNLGAIADAMLGARVSVGLLVEGSALFRFQRYSLDGAPLLNGPAMMGMAGLRLSVEVD
jgi:hypothetical protein